MHGLRGSVDTLATRVDETPDIPFPLPAQDLVVSNPDMANSQVFFTAQTESVEPELVFVTTLPRSNHNEPDSIRAKESELRHFETCNVIDTGMYIYL